MEHQVLLYMKKNADILNKFHIKNRLSEDILVFNGAYPKSSVFKYSITSVEIHEYVDMYGGYSIHLYNAEYSYIVKPIGYDDGKKDFSTCNSILLEILKLVIVDVDTYISGTIWNFDILNDYISSHNIYIVN